MERGMNHNCVEHTSFDDLIDLLTNNADQKRKVGKNDISDRMYYIVYSVYTDNITISI